MKRINRHNPYGYKVGYRENGSRLFVCHFKDRTYREARRSLNYYLTYPVQSHEDRHILINPIWEIRPICFSEFAKGIWRECPF